MAVYDLFQRMQFETVRTLAFGSISGTFARIGTPLLNPARQFLVSNLTNANLMFSVDGINAHFPLVAGAQWINDNVANSVGGTGGFYFPQSGSLFVQTIGGAPSSGSVYFTVIYGD